MTEALEFSFIPVPQNQGVGPGHASMTTTAIYLEAMGEEEREIAARMWSA